MPLADLRSGRGHTVPLAPTAGTQCLSRLRRAHSASRAYGVPYESEPRGVCLPLHRESPTEARDKLPKDRKRRSASDLKKKSTEYRKESSLGKTPGLGSRLLIGKNPSLFVFYFRLANGYRGRIASSAPTAGTQCLSRLRRFLRKQTEKSLLSAPYGKALRKPSESLYKSRKGENPRFLHSLFKIAAENTERPNRGNSHGWVFAVYRENLPFYFTISD